MSMPGYDHALLTGVPLTDPEVKRTIGLLRKNGRMLSHIAGELENLITEQYQLL